MQRKVSVYAWRRRNIRFQAGVRQLLAKLKDLLHRFFEAVETYHQRAIGTVALTLSGQKRIAGECLLALKCPGLFFSFRLFSSDEARQLILVLRLRQTSSGRAFFQLLTRNTSGVMTAGMRPTSIPHLHTPYKPSLSQALALDIRWTKP
ncbi:hypothetical protein [secondary endosymbiont of Ctenarytaina eucalypti]|nr:hypothetical protein [secondary endosymbiont of Ctenarytaina eucalypti]